MENNEYQQQKENREARRQEERSKHKNQSRGQKIKKLFTIFIVLVVVIGLFGSIVPFFSSSTTQNKLPIGTLPAVSDSDWVRGKQDSSVVFIEYADFQCPACGVYYPLVKQLEKEYGDRVKFVFRNYPLSQVHMNALISAYAAESAGTQGKFWEMHDMLFENQQTWSIAGSPVPIFTEYAKKIGIDENKFKEAITSDAVKNKVDFDVLGGDAVGVNATPTFFLNGIKIENPRSYEEFKKVFDEIVPTAQPAQSQARDTTNK